ncbi:MAG: hypothetical protein JNM20_13290 [Rhizobiales bacterium]|nr:hypothetical protein [Hyphomicrobiales bacterium]
MFRRAIGGLALLGFVSLCLPAQAEEARITIIRPPPLAVKISLPREVVKIVNDRHDDRSVHQAVAITIVTVANPYFGDRYRWWASGYPRRGWGRYGWWGETAVYSGPRYPF